MGRKLLSDSITAQLDRIQKDLLSAPAVTYLRGREFLPDSVTA